MSIYTCVAYDLTNQAHILVVHRETTILSGKVSVLGRRIKVLFDFRPESFADRQFQRAKVLASFAELLAEQRPQFVIFDHIYSSWLIDAVKDRGIILTYIAHDDMVVYADSLIGMKPGPLMKMRFAWLRSQYCSLQDKVLQRCDFLLTLTADDAAFLGKDLRPESNGCCTSLFRPSRVSFANTRLALIVSS